MLVHYRVGSLEKSITEENLSNSVHYRVGSLENQLRKALFDHFVHYRVGSLEIKNYRFGDY